MAFTFNVLLRRLVCRDKESISAPHDIFGLAGAVVVDGERHPFAFEPVPVNELQAFDYGETIYDGFSESPQIAIELLGMDIDDNEKWVKNREEAKKWADKISEFTKDLPVIGTFVSAALKAAPFVIDQFVKWDKNDKLLDLTEHVDMAQDTAVPFQKAVPGGCRLEAPPTAARSQRPAA